MEEPVLLAAAPGSGQIKRSPVGPGSAHIQKIKRFSVAITARAATVASAISTASATAAAATIPTTATATATSVAPTTAASAISTATASTTRAGPVFLRPGFIDGQGASVELGAVHGLDCILGFLGRRHRDEGESAGTACGSVQHQVDFEDGAVRGEGVLECVFSRLEREISNEEFRAHV